MADNFDEGFRAENEGIALDDYEVEESEFNTTQNIIFLIECTESLFEHTLVAPLEMPAATPGFPTSTPASARRPTTSRLVQDWAGGPAKSRAELILRSAYSMMRQKINSNPRDKIGIYFYNCVQQSGVNGVQPVLELDISTAARITLLKEHLTVAEEKPKLFMDTYLPITEKVNLVEAVKFAKGKLRSGSARTIDKLIYLFTDNDDPKEVLMTPLRSQLRDIIDSNVELVKFFVPRIDGGVFDLEKFYKNIQEEDDSMTVSLDLESALVQMVEKMNTSDTKRTAFKVKFELSSEITIGVKGYNLIGIKKKRLPVYANLKTRQGQVVDSIIKYFDEDTSEHVDPKTGVKRYMEIGASVRGSVSEPPKIFLDTEQVQKIKQCGAEVGMKLIGFKPIEQLLRPEFTIQSPVFLQPDETTYSGSKRTMTALIASMLKKKVAALIFYLPRASGRPVMAVLHAQKEQIIDGKQTEPPGLHLMQLPFADDIRPVDFAPTPSVADGSPEGFEILNAAKKILKRHTTPYYDPANYKNPALNFHLNTIAAIALSEPLPEPIDLTTPNYPTIHDRMIGFVAPLKDLINQNEVEAGKIVTSKLKRTQETEPASPEDLDAFEDLIRSVDAGANVTVPKLKEGLTMLGAKKSGNKDELLERARDGLIALGRYKNKKIKKEKNEKRVKLEKPVEEITIDDDDDDDDLELASVKREKMVEIDSD